MQMSLLSTFKEAAIVEEAVIIKEYFKTEFSWQDTLNFIYKQTIDKNIELEEKVRSQDDSVGVNGNILTQHPFWLAPQTGLIWKDFPEIKDFLKKINLESGYDYDFADCGYYKEWDARNCTCEALWHSEGIKVSLGERVVNEHSDPWPACYLQSIGNSFWEIKGKNSKVVYELSPGDLLFFPKNTTHKVWAKGPRVGFLINADRNKEIAKSL
jgi:hypothetical protein